MEWDQTQAGFYYQGSLVDEKLSTSQIPKPYSHNHSNTGQPFGTTLRMYDGQVDEDMTPQQHDSCEYVTTPRVNYEGSDPDRGCTEDTPKPSIVDEEDECQGDYDLPFCNDYHVSHMEVHRDFWDIVDSEHECNFCRNFCTVMRCPSCDVQACAYCKDAYS